MLATMFFEIFKLQRDCLFWWDQMLLKKALLVLAQNWLLHVECYLQRSRQRYLHYNCVHIAAGFGF